MTLSHYEHRELAGIERALSRDPTLRIVAGLFAMPVGPRTARPVGDGGRPRRTPVAGSRTARPSLGFVLAMITAVSAALGGLTCVAFAAASRTPHIVAGGAWLVALAVILCVSTAIRHVRTKSRSRSTMPTR